MAHSRILMSLALLLSAGCSSTSQQSEPAVIDVNELLAERNLVMGEQIKRIKNYRIDGWQYVDNRHFIFNAGPAHDYLVRLSSNCSELRFAEAIGFTSTNREVTPFDSVKVGLRNIPQTCPIDALFELNKLESNAE